MVYVNLDFGVLSNVSTVVVEFFIVVRMIPGVVRKNVTRSSLFFLELKSKGDFD